MYMNVFADLYFLLVAHNYVIGLNVSIYSRYSDTLTSANSLKKP